MFYFCTGGPIKTIRFKPIRQISLNIRSVQYMARLVNDKDFEIMHGSDLYAIASGKSNTMDFRASEFSLHLVTHELCHAYHFASFVETAELTPIQVEECMCEMFAAFGPELLKNANTIYNKLKGK